MLRLALKALRSPVPFLRHHCVTRIDSLHRLPLFAAWSGSTAIRHVTLMRNPSTAIVGVLKDRASTNGQTPDAENRLNQRHKTELKFQARLYQSR
jgi:hypothetical protein